MKFEVTDLGPVKKGLTVEIDADEVERETETVLRRFAARVKIPGFRPGKAPLSVVRARFPREIEEDVRERLVARFHAAALDERGLKPLGDPVLEEITHNQGEPFKFRTTFEVLPPMEPKAYRGVEVREPAAAVAEDEVERTLGELREAHARLVTEEGRASSKGDVIVADVEARPDEGEPFRKERAFVEVGAAENLPEFDAAISGVVAGAVLDFTVAYPQDHASSRVAGRTVHYKMLVHEVKRREVPDLDDEFAKDVGEFQDLAALRNRIREDLLDRRRAEIRREVRQSVLEKVLLENPVPLPEILVEEEIRYRLEDMVRAMMLQGLDPSKTNLDWKRLRDRQEEGARRAVHARIVLDAVARAESVTIDPSDLDERIRGEAERLGEKPEVLRARLAKGEGLEALRAQLLREKSLDFLTSVANIAREGGR